MNQLPPKHGMSRKVGAPEITAMEEQGFTQPKAQMSPMPSRMSRNI